MNENLTTRKYSFWPILLAIAVTMIAIGVVSNFSVSAFGLVLLFASIVGWTWENRTETQEDEDE